MVAKRQARGETCRARAQERTGCVPFDRLRVVSKVEPQARAWGITTLGADGAVADKAQAY